MRKLNLTIAAGLVAAILGGGLVLAYGRGIDKKIADGRETVSVLVATSPLEAGATAEEIRTRVETQEIPRAFVADSALSSLEDAAGMSLSGPVTKGSQLTQGQFVGAKDLTVLKPSNGHVALAVGVDISPGVARYLEAGSVVDVFATYRGVQADARGASGTQDAQDAASGGATNRTKLFATGIKVLSVRIAPSQESDEEGSNSGSPGEDVIVLLDLMPRDAEKVVNAVTLGEIYLAMSDGSKHVTPTGTTPDDVVGTGGSS